MCNVALLDSVSMCMCPCEPVCVWDHTHICVCKRVCVIVSVCLCACAAVSNSALTAVGQSQFGCDLSVCLLLNIQPLLLFHAPPFLWVYNLFSCSLSLCGAPFPAHSLGSASSSLSLFYSITFFCFYFQYLLWQFFGGEKKKRNDKTKDHKNQLISVVCMEMLVYYSSKEKVWILSSACC